MHKTAAMARCLVLTLSALPFLAWHVSSQPRSAAIAADDESYGSISGQFVFEGDVPPRPLLFKAGDQKVKDPAICAAVDMPSDELIVDDATKGIANVFVFLPKAKAIHPKLKISGTKEVVFDQKGCRFVPHALFARTDQKVLVKSSDACAHNTHTFPVRATPVNFILPPNSRDGIPVPNRIPDVQPIEVKCDIHPWMKAYWLILDHPYAAITDSDGKFTIADLPAGDYEFRVWHEKIGHLDKAWKVTVEAGKTTDLGVTRIPAARFETKEK